MNRILMSLLVLGFATAGPGNAAVIIGGSLNNGNLDRTHAVEIVPGFFLPKPDVWQNVGTRSITGPYEDEMSSEPWAGPAPTPVTTDNSLNPPFPDGCGDTSIDGDCAVFFKPFSGGGTNGTATAHLFQDNPGTPGMLYTLTGWAGAEANIMVGGAEFAIDFLDAGSVIIGSQVLDLLAAGLLTPNGEPFNYKEYMVASVAPANTATVRARVSMLDGIGNPAGGGQAFVVDDFTLTEETSRVPEPATLALVVLGMVGLAQIRRRRT